MKMLWYGVFVWGAVTTLLHADEIVVPAAQATQVGNDFILGPFLSPGSIDSVYGSKNFSGPVMINGVAFRLEEASLNQSYNTVIPRVTIRLSTFSGTYNSYLVGPGYAGNKGPDDTTVFDASVHWITTDLPSGPNPFDLKVQFSKPFIYDPSSGSLLMDFATSGSFTGIPGVDSQGHGDATLGWYGNKSLGNLVTQFDVSSVPEPSTIWLVLGGASSIYFLRTKKTNE
jgi:hypothetical protein